METEGWGARAYTGMIYRHGYARGREKARQRAQPMREMHSLAPSNRTVHLSPAVPVRSFHPRAAQGPARGGLGRVIADTLHLSSFN